MRSVLLVLSNHKLTEEIQCARKPTSNSEVFTDTLLKTSRKKDIELTEKELGQVTGGKGQVEYLTVKLTDVIISGVSPGGSGKD